MRNYTSMFLLFFSASIMGGMALKDSFEYSMLVAYGLAIVFLICAVISLGKRIKQSEVNFLKR